MSGDQRPIVVGVDDSSGTKAALQWAADDAQARKVPVRAVCAYRYTVPRVPVPGYVDIPELELQQPRQAAEQLVRRRVSAWVHAADRREHVDGYVESVPGGA
jgi:nucleotide-binding universal stress UspA family protein